MGANSADPDQTAPRGAVWSGYLLFAIPYASLSQNILRFGLFAEILGRLQQRFLASQNLGTLRYSPYNTNVVSPPKVYLNGNSNEQPRNIEPLLWKNDNVYFDQVWHKPGCTATEDRKRLEILVLESRGIALSK